MSDSERLALLLGAFESTLVGPRSDERLRADPQGFFRDQGVHPRDAAALAATGADRILVYRHLVRRGLEGAIRVEIPRTAARLGAAFEGWVASFLDEDPPRSHYLRDVAFAFVAWARPRWATDAGVPRFLGDLARHELAMFEVGAAPDADDAALPSPEIDRPVVFHPSARLLRYDWAVHRLSSGPGANDVPAAEPTALFAYRDRDDEVRFLEMSPLAAAMLERLLAGTTLRNAVLESPHASSSIDAILAGAATVLTDLQERGALLGAGCLS